jgi:hypothetical protein
MHTQTISSSKQPTGALPAALMDSAASISSTKMDLGVLMGSSV